MHDLGEVPEEREREHDHADQREGPFAVVVGDPHHREGPEQPDHGRGLEPGASQAVEQLHRRGRHDDRDQNRSCCTTDCECEQRHRNEDGAVMTRVVMSSARRRDGNYECGAAPASESTHRRMRRTRPAATGADGSTASADEQDGAVRSTPAPVAPQGNDD